MLGPILIFKVFAPDHAGIRNSLLNGTMNPALEVGQTTDASHEADESRKTAATLNDPVEN